MDGVAAYCFVPSKDKKANALKTRVFPFESKLSFFNHLFLVEFAFYWNIIYNYNI